MYYNDINFLPFKDSKSKKWKKIRRETKGMLMIGSSASLIYPGLLERIHFISQFYSQLLYICSLITIIKIMKIINERGQWQKPACQCTGYRGCRPPSPQRSSGRRNGKPPVFWAQKPMTEESLGTGQGCPESDTTGRSGT